MKKPLVYISVSLLSLMLLVIVFFDFNYKTPKQMLLIPQNNQGLKSLIVKNNNQGYTILKENNLITVLGIDSNLIDTVKCQKLLSNLLNLTINELTEQSLQLKKQYGLQKPLATASVNYYIDKKIAHIEVNIGNKAPANLGNYAQLSGKDEIFILPEEIADLLLASQTEFISREIFKDIADFKTADWQLNIFTPNKDEKTFLMKNAEKSAVYFVNGNQKALLSSTAKKKIMNLLNLQAIEIEKISPGLDDIDMYGLLVPYMQINVSSGEKSELLKISTPKDGMCFVMLSSRNIVFRCNKDDIFFLDNNEDYKNSLYKKYIFDLQEQEINSFNIKIKDKNVEIRKANGIWHLYINEKLSTQVDSNKFIDEIWLQFNKLELTNGELKMFDSSATSEVDLKINYENEQKDNYQFFVVEDDAYITYKTYNICFKVDKKMFDELCNILRKV
ncbi:MAG: DUF4340 domain-containing protein [Oscillospiraceae bacterium]